MTVGIQNGSRCTPQQLTLFPHRGLVTIQDNGVGQCRFFEEYVYALASTTTKNIEIINSIGLMIIVWRVLGKLLGLVKALDTIEFLGEISTARLAGGLKISALPTMFGCLVFVICRIASIIFTWIAKESE